MAVPFKLDNRAALGFQNGSSYDLYRPSYPPEAVERLLTHLGVSGVDGAKLIDLACGTGKFTELLARRKEGFEVIGVEPHAGMRAEVVKKGLKGVEVKEGDAGHIPVDENWGDACIAAQAFHWFATEEALKEIHRVLHPGAAFGMIWNVEDYNAPLSWPSKTQWEQKLKDIMAQLDDGAPRFRHLKWKEVFENQMETTPLQALKDTFSLSFPSFSLPIGEDTVDWTDWLSNEGVWARYSTLSQIVNLTEQRREEIRKQVMEALEKDVAERNDKGEVAVHGVTFFAWTSRV